MRYMKKFISVLTVLLFVLMPQAAVRADNTLESFKITGGLLDEAGELREKEITFDERRTVAGLAPRNTSVTITVYSLDESAEAADDDVAEPESEEDADEGRVILGVYEFYVGISGMFSKTIDLCQGDNYVEISASLGDLKYSRTCLLTRKPVDIKSNLQSPGIFPWQMLTQTQPPK